MIVDINEIERCLRYFKAINVEAVADIVWMRGDEKLTPRQFCDPDTVAALADRVMIVEAELLRVQKLSLSECGIGFVDMRVLMPNV